LFNPTMAAEDRIFGDSDTITSNVIKLRK
jgi:hypothetical protein